MSNNSQGKRAEPSSGADNGVPLRAAQQHNDWADNWFAGSAACPVCGSDDMKILRLTGDDATRIEEWQCAVKACATQWKVELRESAIGIYLDDNGVDVDWYERAEEPSYYYIVAKDGREMATILAALNYWRREGLMSAGHEQDLATDDGRIHSLSGEEIDALCERIKHGDSGSLLR